MVGVHRDAHRRAHVEQQAAQLERRLERVGGARAASASAGSSRSRRGEQRELVAAEARDGDLGRQRRRAGGAATCTSSSSPCVVAERVVDRLEVVEVEQQRDGAARRSLDVLAQPLEEEPPVRQLGQLVVQRAVLVETAWRPPTWIASSGKNSSGTSPRLRLGDGVDDRRRA